MDVGVEVMERQELIYLPTAASAMAEVDIHEASLDKVQLGLPAIITVDALPGKKFMGTMARIAPLPDPQSMWMNPDLKVYQSDIHLEGDDPGLRTGMSCKAEIIAAQYENVIYIPVQAVIRVAGKPTVYVVKDGRMEEREVEIGLDNNRMIVIEEGLKEGEIVLLTPPLKSAEIDSASAAGGADGSSDSLMQRINERLDEVNSAPVPRPDTSGQGGPGGFGQGPGEGAGGQMPRQPGNMSQQDRERMRERIQNMSEEERQKFFQQMRQRQGAGGQPGGGPGQGGPRQGGSRGAGGGRTPGAGPGGGGRNQ
jgi:hypothetical protein